MSTGEPKQTRLGAWLEQRAGWRKLMHEGLDEPIPGRSRWAYVFGSGLLFIFVSQAITGVFLTLYYVPSADHAHTTVSFIQKEVWAGAFVRSIHSYGSSAMVVVLLLHLGQTFLYGAYKNRRELLWLAGCFLFLLVLGMSFTGYLLPWDQKAYAATAVATNILAEVPWVGSGLKKLLRGGNEMGTLTLSRFFALHILIIPALIAGTVAAHVFLFRRAGAAGPPLPPEKLAILPVEPFFPRQVFKDFTFGVALIAVLAYLALRHSTLLGPMANPSDPTYLPRPEWYYVPVFQWLKYWHGPASVLGIVVAPALVFLALFLVPFIDRSPERRPLRRPIANGIFFAVFAGLIWLGFRSHQGDMEDPSVRSKLAAQEAEEKRFSTAAFEPEQTGTSAASVQGTRALSAKQAKGALLFVSESCSGCHGAEGRGGAGLFALRGLDKRYPGSHLTSLLHHPNPAMLQGGMEPVQLPDAEMENLTDYVRVLQP